MRTVRKRMTRKGFMGWTHFLISFSIILLINLFWPVVIPTFGLQGYQYFIIFILVIALTSGSSLYPDIDNDPSTVTNKLGLLGKILSKLFGFVSIIVYNVAHTRKDKTKSKTHRLIWHTPFIWIVIGLLFHLTIPDTQTSGFELIKSGWADNLSLVIFALVSYFAIWVALGFMLPSSIRKFTFIPALLLTGFMLSLPVSNIRGLVICISFGALLHVLEDFITQGSIPIAFPIPIKGQLWAKPWVLGKLQIYTGGATEKIITLIAGGTSLVLTFITVTKMIHI